MAGVRAERVAEGIRTELAELLREGLKDPRVGFVSIVKVEVTRDLSVAKIFFSVLGNDEAKKNSLKGLESAAGFLRSELSRRMQLRYMPELRFVLDESIEHGVRISQLLNEANRQGQEKSDG
jgi:ribosome-binding factor A